MHLKGSIQSEVLLIYILLMVTKTLSTTDNMESIVSVNTGQYAKVTTIVHRTILSKEKLQQIFALQQIWGNIRKARFHIKKQSDVIRNFYSKVQQAFNGDFVYEWLPKEHFQLFENEIRHLDKHNKVTQMIPILYESLEIFLFTFEEMLSFNAHNQHVVQISVYDNRRNILEQIMEDLKSILEEVKNGIDTFKLTIKSTNVTEIKNMWNWESKWDHTFVMLRDWGVITKYYKFIKEWEKITKTIFENYCNITHITHKCHKFLKASNDSVT